MAEKWRSKKQKAST